MKKRRDEGHEETDKLLEDLEKKIAKEYKQAAEEAQAKLDDYLRRFEIKDEKWQIMVASGKKTAEEYKKWRTGQIMIGQRWEDLRGQLAEDYHNANVIARSYIDGKMTDVYALNHNYATFQIEKDGLVDTAYTLYNRETVEMILTENPDLLPPPGKKMKASIAAGKDIAWQEGKLQSTMLQSILQGESIPNISKRIANTLGETNHASTIRYARTAATAAENAGREDAYKRAESLGVKMQREWLATLDNRTRHEHRMLDGQKRAIDEPFEVDGEEIMFPGDPSAPGYLIWNCRCRTVAAVDGWEDMSGQLRSNKAIGDMTYDQWLNAKPQYEKITRPEERERSAKEGYINELYRDSKKGVYSSGEDSIIGARATGSRQARDKRERVSELEDALTKSVDDPNVTAWCKPIVGEHTRKQDVDATNPNFITGEWQWKNNCQRCVTTYEARRRGYDVTALPCYSLDDKYARGLGYILPYDKGDRKANTLWYEAGVKFSESRSFTTQQCVETIDRLMNEYGNGSRAIIQGSWPSGLDHVFIAENVGGKVQFFDPQNGDMNCSSYLESMRPASMSIFRIDDLPFNDNISEVFRNDVE